MTQTADLKTRRLVLRPLKVEDAKRFARLFGDDKDAVAMTATLPNPCTEEEAAKWIQHRIDGNSRVFAIFREKDALFIGAIGLGGGDPAELGYGIGRPFWGRGYATEVVRAVVAHAREIGVERIEAYTFQSNPASARVLEKSGFSNLGKIIRNYPERGGRRAVFHHIVDGTPRTNMDSGISPEKL